jgi:hypothetical protein
MAFVARCYQFCYRLIDLGLPALRFRHEAGDRPPMAGDDDSFTALDLVEELRQMGFRLRGLDFSHNRHEFVWSIQLVDI